MKHRDIGQQIWVEHRLLKHLLEGMRAALSWKLRGEQIARKLSTLLFISQCLQRHLERLMSLEEQGGYMDLVLQTSPRLAKSVGELQHEHAELQQTVRDIVMRLEVLSPGDPIAFSEICEQMQALLNKLDAHNNKEMDLVQEAVETEVGGEG